MTTVTTGRSLFTLPNAAFVAVTLGAFAIFYPSLNNTPVLLIGALVAAGLGSAAWWLLRRREAADPRVTALATRILIGAVFLIVATVAFSGVQVLASWNDIGRQDYSYDAAKDILNPVGSPGPSETTTTFEGATTSRPPAPNEAFQTVLLIGGDERSGNGDVILYLVNPTNGADPFMMSFPRDLWIQNPCTGASGRINVLARGCAEKDINGGTLLSVKVSEMTGIEVDHFALFDFDGFESIIDAVGGVELCVENPVRDTNSGLDLPAGCTDADGEQALAWVRSRHTQEFRDGGWYHFPGAGDLLRNEHQQELILKLIAKLKNFETPQQLSNIVGSVSDAFTLSNTISLSQALSLAWSFRDIDLEEIQRLELPVYLTRSDSDQSILKTRTSPREVIEEYYGAALPSEED